MQSSPNSAHSAEDNFRLAFLRLQAGKPIRLPLGTRVSQNNVAREAGCDPSALRKSRFPSLIREIKAYVEIHESAQPSKRSELRKARKGRAEYHARLAELALQRDLAQSKLLSAQRRIVELRAEIRTLRVKLDDLQTLPTRIRRE